MLKVWLRLRPLALAIAIGFGFYVLLRLIETALWVLVLILVSIILAAALMPVVRFVERRQLPPFGWRVPRSVTVVVVDVLVIALVAALFYAVGKAMLQELFAFLSRLPQIAESIARSLDEIERSVGLPSVTPSAEEVGAYVRSLLLNLASTLTLVESFVGAIVNFLVGFFFVLFLSLFLVVEAEGIRDFWVGLFPPEHRSHVSDLFSTVGSRVGRWIIGQFTVAVISGILAGIAALLLGVPFPLVIGAATTLLDLAPFLGPSIMIYPVFFLLLPRSIFWAIAGALIFYGLAHFDGNVLSPLITGRAVRLSASLVLISLPIGLALYGVIGALIAVPVAAAIKVITIDVIVPWLYRLEGVPEEQQRLPPV